MGTVRKGSYKLDVRSLIMIPEDFKDSNQQYVYFLYAVCVILGFTGKRDLRDPSSV